MRSGNLDRTITLQGVTNAVDDYGTATQAWADFATVRAQLVQSATEEFLRGYGEGAGTVLIFRTRWIDGVTTEQRVTYEGRQFNVREIKEIGRRKGLELRCEEVRT